MKQTITALLLALTLTLGLSGCTSKKDNGSNQGDDPSNSTTQNGSNTSNGTMNGGTNSGSNGSNGSSNGGSGNGTDNGTTPSDGSRSYYSYGQPGSNDATNSESGNDFLRGYSYEQMLRNGRVRDTNGILTDGESSVTDW